MSETIPTPADLLRELDWMRALARELVSDPDQAEDLTHDTLLIGLERPPRFSGGLRSWIATVMRNRLRESVRLRQNQQARERLEAKRESTEEAEDLAERMRMQQAVSRHLLELEEPYRSTLLMRFYGELPPRVIAKRQGVPLATVKSRLHRGLARLRERLDGSYPDRSSWLAALVPWTLESRSVLVGGVLMKLKMAVGAALLIAWGAWMIGPWAGGRVSDLAETVTPESAPRPSSTEPGLAGGLVGERDVVIADADPSQDLAAPTEVLEIARSNASLRGVLLDVVDGHAIQGATLRLAANTGPLPRGFELEDDRGTASFVQRTDEAGCFTFDDVPEGPYSIDIDDGSGRRKRDWVAATVEGAYVQLWIGDRSPGVASRDLALFVRDQRGEAVAQAQLNLRGSGAHQSLQTTHAWTRITDATGWATFEEAGLTRGILFAEDGTGRVARLDFASAESLERQSRGFVDENGEMRRGVGVTLTEPGSIEGVVRGGTARRVTAWAKSWHRTTQAATRVPFSAEVDDSGQFQFEGLAPGTYDLTVDAAPGWRLVVANSVLASEVPTVQDPNRRFHEYVPVSVTVRAGERAYASLDLVKGARLSGQVRTLEADQPVEGARVLAILPQGLTSDPDRVELRGVPLWRLDSAGSIAELDPTTTAETRTDAEGRYVFEGLPPGPFWRIEVFGPRLSFDRVDGVHVRDGEDVDLEHRLAQAGGIQGVCSGVMNLGVLEKGAEQYAAMLGTPRRSLSLFVLPGLPAGRYEIHAIPAEVDAETTKLTELIVRAGELTWVDLTAASPQSVRGRVLYREQPLAGAVLDFFGPQVVTNDAGLFEWSYPFVSSGQRDLMLVNASNPDSTSLRVEYHGMCNGLPELPEDIRVPDGALEVSVLDEEGQPLSAWVELSLVGEFDDEPLGSIAKFTRRLDDREKLPERPYRVEILDPWFAQSRARRKTNALGRVRFATLPAGTYRVRVVGDEANYIAPAVTEVGEGNEVECTLRPVVGGNLLLKVQRADHSPVVGEPVHLVLSGDEYPYVRTTDAQGHVRVRHAPPGRVRVLYPTHTPWDVSRVEGTVELAGELELTLTRIEGQR